MVVQNTQVLDAADGNGVIARVMLYRKCAVYVCQYSGQYGRAGLAWLPTDLGKLVDACLRKNVADGLLVFPKDVDAEIAACLQLRPARTGFCRTKHDKRRIEGQRRKRLCCETGRLALEATRRDYNPSGELPHRDASIAIIEVPHLHPQRQTIHYSAPNFDGQLNFPTMSFSIRSMNSAVSEPEQFRSEVQEWLAESCPPSMRTATPEDEVIWGGRSQHFKNPDSKVWLERMAERGWTAPTWPKQYGGGGLSFDEQRILQQELARAKARAPLNSFGIWMLGPALLEYANEEQKLEYLPKIVRGEIRWCQGYSEPSHGSDLAALQTKAEDMGDYYLVNGSKIWTSYADEADWIFCLVRTEPNVPKHQGISFLLFDMASEGISTSPIELISGSSPFCQTFFDDVKEIGRAHA